MVIMMMAAATRNPKGTPLPVLASAMPVSTMMPDPIICPIQKLMQSRKPSTWASPLFC